MGLDSIELLLEFEKYFQIEIPDQVAEKIYTVKDMTDYISSVKKVSIEDSQVLKSKKEEILLLLRDVFQKELVETEMISNYLTKSTKEKWKELEKSFSYKIDNPFGFLNRYVRFDQPRYEWNEVSVAGFIDGILICNFEDWVDFDNPSCWSEVYFGVAGITVDRLGIDAYEIQPEKFFTKDLRID